MAPGDASAIKTQKKTGTRSGEAPALVPEGGGGRCELLPRQSRQNNVTDVGVIRRGGLITVSFT